MFVTMCMHCTCDRLYKVTVINNWISDALSAFSNIQNDYNYAKSVQS